MPSEWLGDGPVLEARRIDACVYVDGGFIIGQATWSKPKWRNW